MSPPQSRQLSCTLSTSPSVQPNSPVSAVCSAGPSPGSSSERRKASAPCTRSSSQNASRPTTWQGMPSWAKHRSISSSCRRVRHSTAISPNARASAASPRDSSMPTPPTICPMRLAIHTPSENASGAVITRTGAPSPRLACSTRCCPGLCAITASALRRIAGAER